MISATKESEQVEDIEGEKTESDESLLQLFTVMNQAEEEDKTKHRVIALHEDINEESASTLIHNMFALRKLGEKEEEFEIDKDGNVVLEPLEIKEGEAEEEIKITKLIKTYEPFEIIVSTKGGDASEMFAIYDAMRLIQQDCEIETTALGKVMSAGVLIFASGTKGKRRIGANCRVMIHAVSAATVGEIHDIENETKELKWIQSQYVKGLARETKMSEAYLKKLMKKKVNIYLGAEEAVKLGIADEII